jgi:hypothetical protein
VIAPVIQITRCDEVKLPYNARLVQMSMPGQTSQQHLEINPTERLDESSLLSNIRSPDRQYIDFQPACQNP